MSCADEFQEMRRGTRAQEQVRITQASALKDNACVLSCVYETAAQRLLRVEIRGKSSATDVESADYGKGLLGNLMQLLDNAGTSTALHAPSCALSFARRFSQHTNGKKQVP